MSEVMNVGVMNVGQSIKLTFVSFFSFFFAPFPYSVSE